MAAQWSNCFGGLLFDSGHGSGIFEAMTFKMDSAMFYFKSVYYGFDEASGQSYTASMRVNYGFRVVL